MSKVPIEDDNFEVSRMFARLRGLPLTCCCHALNLAMFDFGLSNRIITKSGWAYYSDYAFHVQCGWLLTRGSTIIAGSDDCNRPLAEEPEGSSSDDKALLLSDRFRLLNVDCAGRFVINKAELFLSRRAVIQFNDDHLLDIFPLTSSQNPETEFWRLIESRTGSHLIAAPGGLRITDPQAQ
jgi:hypothetical protein